MMKNTKSIKLTLYKKNKKLAIEWHPAKNIPLTPEDVTFGSGKKVWWVCSNGHEWETAILGRNRGRGCPYCAGKKVCEDNCLQTVNPRLAREWHPTENASLTPKEVTSGSGKKVWWVCKKGHKWEAIICIRSRGSGCPYCSGYKVSKENCLQNVNPRLVGEWHPTKNIPLTPKDVSYGSDKKVWWMCRKGHEWNVSVSHRTRGRGCPYCAGHKVSKGNCLQTVNPRLAREWHPTKNVPLTPKDVVPGSQRKIWWICRRKGHEWKTKISHRNDGSGCPYCARKKATEENCLQTVNPWLSRQWHQIKNDPLTPRDVVPGSHKKVWWVCQKGHEWPEAVADRFRGSGCPYCYRGISNKHRVTNLNQNMEIWKNA